MFTFRSLLTNASKRCALRSASSSSAVPPTYTPPPLAVAAPAASSESAAWGYGLIGTLIAANGLAIWAESNNSEQSLLQNLATLQPVIEPTPQPKTFSHGLPQRSKPKIVLLKVSFLGLVALCVILMLSVTSPDSTTTQLRGKQLLVQTVQKRTSVEHPFSLEQQLS